MNPLIVFAQELGDSQSRLNALKNEYSIVINDEQKQKIIATCTESVELIGKVQQSNLLSNKKRILLYKDVTKELKAIEFRTLRQGVDTSELDLMIGKNQQQIKTINLLSENQNTLLNDIKSIDCKANPELFLAGLYKFRENQKSLIDTVTAIQSELKNSYDYTFKPLSERLKL
jgi:hypothetical protein